MLDGDGTGTAHRASRTHGHAHRPAYGQHQRPLDDGQLGALRHLPLHGLPRHSLGHSGSARRTHAHALRAQHALSLDGWQDGLSSTGPARTAQVQHLPVHVGRHHQHRP